jgi:hypothetical protein
MWENGHYKSQHFDIELKSRNLEDFIISKSKIESKLIYIQFQILITCIDIINITNIAKTCINIFDLLYRRIFHRIMHIGTIFSKMSHHMNIIGYFLILGWSPTI